MPICGPKLSLCGVILSAWGILQLVIVQAHLFNNKFLLLGISCL
jgi:ribonuclease kappa